jgi:DNA-3-methyladenine glycosylase
MPRLARRFYRRDPVTLARALLGCTLVRITDDGSRLAGRIVETEAYLGPQDRAAHTFNGRRTPRNESMYRDGGHGYVYFTYGMHHCFNVVAGRADEGVACLIRALEPIDGLDVMRRHRAGKLAAARLRDRDLCSGPAKLTQSLAIDRSLDGVDLVVDGRLFIERGRVIAADRIVAATRIGVAYAGEWARRPLRFLIAANPHVSVSPRRVAPDTMTGRDA